MPATASPPFAMCGIAGLIGPGAADHAQAVQAMLDEMRHRGPDGEGLFVAPSHACVLGHRRLAVLDVSAASAQPMHSPDGTHTIVYNGECYNAPDLKHALEATGERFSTTGDTEIVLRQFQREGESAAQRLNAMFALLVWDEPRQRLVVARDAFGQKPLYWAPASNGPWLVFASELRALLASGFVMRHLHGDAVAGFLAYGAVPQPWTVVHGVEMVPRGHVGTISVIPGQRPTFTPRPFLAPRSTPTNVTPTADDIRAAWFAAVKRHLVSDVPIGLFLSGGVDSSAIAAAAVRATHQAETVRSLTVVFPDQPAYSEHRRAEAVARFMGTRHTEIPITGATAQQAVVSSLAAMDQPSIDGLNTYLVSQAARQAGLTVALSGLGGDELFGGYHTFADVPVMARWRPWLGWLRPILAVVARVRPVWNLRLGKWLDWLEAPAGIIPAYLSRRRLFSTRQLRNLWPTRDLPHWWPGVPPARWEELTALTRGVDGATAVSELELAHYMGDMLLRDTDNFGMAQGLEIRAPVLDAEFAHLARRVPKPPPRQGPVPKPAWVEALGDWLPPAVRGPKQGFALPMSEWLRHELRPVLDHGLTAVETLGLSPSAISQWRDAFLRWPQRVGWARLWALAVLGHFVARHHLFLI